MQKALLVGVLFYHLCIWEFCYKIIQFILFGDYSTLVMFWSVVRSLSTSQLNTVAFCDTHPSLITASAGQKWICGNSRSTMSFVFFLNTKINFSHCTPNWLLKHISLHCVEQGFQSPAPGSNPACRGVLILGYPPVDHTVRPVSAYYHSRPPLVNHSRFLAVKNYSSLS